MNRLAPFVAAAALAAPVTACDTEGDDQLFDGEGVKADVDFGPTLMLNRNRCTLCTRCVRFMREVDTDAQINIVDRGYVRVEERRLRPEPVADIVTDLLVEHFGDYVDVEFTARMEDDLDDIASGTSRPSRMPGSAVVSAV